MPVLFKVEYDIATICPGWKCASALDWGGQRLEERLFHTGTSEQERHTPTPTGLSEIEAS